MYCLPLSLPELSSVDNQRIIDCYMNNFNSSKHPSGNKNSNYRNLFEFDNKKQFFDELFKNKIDSEFVEYMSIQRITGTVLIPHIDVHRKVTAMYTVKGPADTSFYDSLFKEIQCFRMDLNKWYLFNNGEYHGVKNIEGDDRISLVIDLTPIFKTFDQAAQILNARDLLQT